MQDILGESLRQLKKVRIRKMWMIAVVLVLSLVVSLDVFWVLRQPGLTLAGNADCGIVEHTHDGVCQNSNPPCALTEHTHTLQCYADETADVETQLDWQKLFADYPFTGDLATDLAGIAKTQVGYTESKLNFQATDGIYRGYTRYGAWYGTPYNDWSALFVSFCLHYAGADPEEYPSNTGVNSMAEQWKKSDRYAAAGQYTPKVGDVVFFKDNTAGIVTEVLDFTCYAISGDVENAVVGRNISLKDTSIAGWGLVNGTAANRQESSTGPVFHIYINGEVQTQTKPQRYALRNTTLPNDLLDYLEANRGSYFFTLLDKNNHELPKDANGNYIAQADTGYRLTTTFTSPAGFLPGTYQYQVPNGLMVDGGKGIFVLKDGTNVGSWVVTDTGLITLTFDDEIKNHTDITISATMGIHFPAQDEPIDFDGKITVTVEKPQQEILATKVNKWGVQGNPATEKNDPTKLYWTVQITGNRDSQIPGSILTDQILRHDWSYAHRYTDSDIAGGLSFGASVVDPETGEELYWHRWNISANDPNLTWDENGWSYKMPETITCQVCGNTATLGNEHWTYYVDYTSTPDVTNIAGGLPYTNQVEIDNQTAEGWAEFTQTEVHGDVFKNGTFVSDANGGKFLWELQVTIPGRKDGDKAFCDWFINDIMTVRDQYGARVTYVPNDIHLATVTANYHGKTINVPRIQDATEDDPYAWMLYWSNDQGGNGFYDLRQIYILCRCECTDESCGLGNCWTYGFVADDGSWKPSSNYCPCWTETEDTTFTFTYQTEDLSVVGDYGGMGYTLQNEVMLAYAGGTPVADTYATIPIPSLLKKELSHDFNGYTAHYRVTVNEAKLVLTNGMPLTIHDEMTDTLAYIGGSLIITTEDANGNRAELQQGVDYTVTYDGTGNKKDPFGKPVHVLDIVLLHPQPVMYILDYDTTLIMPDKVTEGIKYSNSASISLWGQDITENSTEKVYADINISTKNYKINLYKTSALTGKPLPGATFGLFNEHGGLIATAVTNAQGSILFQTNVVEGIILQAHSPYYIQELDAPDGYQLDDTRHWFCFCDKQTEYCETCHAIMVGTDALRIPPEKTGQIHITNQLMNFDLPSTGGPGIYPLMLVSVVFIITPLVYFSILRRKRERRGVG